MMKPGPWRITFDTNPDDCNLRCIMCEGFSPHSTVIEDRIHSGRPRRRMDIHVIRKILKQAEGSALREIIPSTMGEPLLYKDFDEIIEMCYQYGLKLNLTTNGTFPKRPAEEWAKMLVPVTSDVKISWNGATKKTQEEIMLGSSWEKVLKNIEAFIQVRNSYAEKGINYCRLTLQLTFLKTNVSELADIVKLAIDLGFDRVKGHHLWAHFPEIKHLSMRQNKASIDEWNKAVEKALGVAEKFPLPNGKQIVLENIHFLEYSASLDLDPKAICPFLGQEAWVNAEGEFNPCCAPDELRKQLGSFGNLSSTSLEEIWKSKDYQNLQENYKKHPLCIGCNMRR